MTDAGLKLSARSKLVAWLQLFRLPNLFTVPGDPLVGAIIIAPLAGLGLLLLAIVPSLCLYCGGLLLNDYFDLNEDRRERPDRPLPSGRVPSMLTLKIGLGLLFAGVAIAAVVGPLPLGLAFVLCLLVFVYDVGAKRLPVIGSLVMGACRGLSVLLGAAMVVRLPAYNLIERMLGGPYVVFLGVGEVATEVMVCLVAAIIAFYVVAVSEIARNETTKGRVTLLQVIPLAFVCVLLLALAFVPELGKVAGGAARNPASIAAVICGLGLVISRLRISISAYIGILLRFLIPIQAAFIMSFNAVAALVLLGLWLVATVVARRFYAS